MSKRGWALFVALGIIWGMPYLLIRIAVGTIDPLVVAFGRTLVGSLLLLPMALHRKVLRFSPSPLGEGRGEGRLSSTPRRVSTAPPRDS